MTIYTIYTDGAYSSSIDQGGIGVAIIKDDKLVYQYNQMYRHTTNNRMEIWAVVTGLSCIKGKIDRLHIVSDSQYVIGCITKGWQRKKNKDLWEKFDAVESKVKELCPDIRYRWVRGHSSDKWNNFVDSLAVKASHEIHQS